MKKLTLITCLLFCNYLQSQSINQSYNDFIKKADSLYKIKQYYLSGLMYLKAFQVNSGDGKTNDLYNSACSWAYANCIDSSFYYLHILAFRKSFVNYTQLLNDTDLNPLKKDERWNKIINKVKDNKKFKEKNYDFILIKLIDSLVNEDQYWRKKYSKILISSLDSQIKYKDIIVNKVSELDSLNYITLQQIYHKYKYPGNQIIGDKGSTQFFVLVQHQDKHPHFQDSVLNYMKIEVDSGRANASNYAYLLDRVKINLGDSQVYGTQMHLNEDSTSYTPLPVINPELLNERRRKVGLGTIEEYIRVMNEHYLRKKD